MKKTLVLLCACAAAALPAAPTTPELKRAERASTIYHNVKGSAIEIQATAHIDPKERAKDFEEAFKKIMQNNPQACVYAIVSGVSVDEITGFEVMPNSTLVLLTIGTGTAQKQQVVRVEDIEKLDCR